MAAIKIVLFRIPSMMEEFFQFMVLIAMTFTMAKIASKSELTIIYSSGYSMWKVLRNYSIFIFLFGLFSICCLNLLFTNLKKESIFLENKYTKHENKYFVEYKNGLWFKQIDINNKDVEIIIRADRAYLNDLSFDNCILLFTKSGNFEKRYEAESMKLINGMWVLKNINIYSEDKEKNFEEELRIPTNISQDFMRQQIQNKYEDIELIPLFSLNKLIKEFKISGLDTYRFVARKNILTLTPFIYILMIMLGVLFSNNHQRNTKNILNIFEAIVCGICIFVVQNILFELAMAGKINLFIATWGFLIFGYFTVIVLLLKKIELQNVRINTIYKNYIT